MECEHIVAHFSFSRVIPIRSTSVNTSSQATPTFPCAHQCVCARALGLLDTRYAQLSISNGTSDPSLIFLNVCLLAYGIWFNTVVHSSVIQ